MKDFYLEELEKTQEELIKLIRASRLEKGETFTLPSPMCLQAVVRNNLFAPMSGVCLSLKETTLNLEIMEEGVSSEQIIESLTGRFSEVMRGSVVVFSYIEKAFERMRTSGITCKALERMFTSRSPSAHLFYLLPYLEEIAAAGISLDFSLVEENRYDYALIRVEEGFKFVPLSQYRLEVAKKLKFHRLEDVENFKAKEWIRKRLTQIKTLEEIEKYFDYNSLIDMTDFFNSKDFFEVEEKLFKISVSAMQVKINQWKKRRVKFLKSKETERDKKRVWTFGGVEVFELLSHEAIECEGLVMRNCLKSNFINFSHTKIFSFRQKDKSVVCLAWDLEAEQVEQFKAFANKAVSEEFQEVVVAFLRDYLKVSTTDHLPSGLAQELGVNYFSPFPKYPKFSLLNFTQEKLEANLLCPWGWNREMLEVYLSSTSLQESAKIALLKALNAHYCFEGIYLDFELRKKLSDILEIENEAFSCIDARTWVRENRHDLSCEALEWHILKYFSKEKEHLETFKELNSLEQKEFIKYFQDLICVIRSSRCREVENFLEELRSFQKD